MKWPISSHNNQVGHHEPCHHAECQHKLVALCPDPSVPLVYVAVFVAPVGVALSFVAEQAWGRRIVVAAAGEHIAAAVADSQHYTVAAVVLGRSLLERTWLIVYVRLSYRCCVILLVIFTVGFWLWILCY